MTDHAEYMRVEALRRDATARYEARLAAARAEKAARWPEHRAEIMRQWVAVKREREERGEPFLMPDPPPLDPPDWFLADVRVPDEPVHPAPPPNGSTAPGVDPLGRPTARLLTAEEQFERAAKRSVGERVRDVVRRQS